MPKKRTKPVKAADGTERHPAFGLASVHRVHAHPGEVLFQSDLRHPEYVTITVKEASRKRDLRHDWVHGERQVLEIAMSMSQFASFIASGGTEGVPCTIEWTTAGSYEPGERPGLVYEPRLTKTHDEVHKAAEDAYSGIDAAYKSYEATLSLAGKGATAARKDALRHLQAAISNAAGNVAYATKCLDEHAENVVEKSRADIEAIAVRAAEKVGLEVSDLPALEAGSDG